MVISLLQAFFFGTHLLLKSKRYIPRINDDLLGSWYIEFGFSALSNDYKMIRFDGPLAESCYARWTILEYVNRAQVYSFTKQKSVERRGT